MKARLILTAEQVAEITPHLRPGRALLARVLREPFNGTNAATSGRLTIEFGSVPEASLPALRDAILKANAARRDRQARPKRRRKQHPAMA